MTTTSSSKQCVFCRTCIQKKSKEHVVPAWLLKYTGNPSRKIFLGYDLTKDRIARRSFSAKSLTVPACKECNTRFSYLEARAQRIVKRIIEDGDLYVSSIDVLLDWLDKVRIGLWLAYINLNKNIYEIIPNFGVAQRIAAADRLVFIYKCRNITNGLGWTSVDCPYFQFSPSCFTLRIKSTFFFNASTDFLISRRVGLPYPCNRFMSKADNRVGFDIVEGKCRLYSPIIRRQMHPDGLFLFQPIIRSDFSCVAKKYYENQYVNAHYTEKDEGRIMPLLQTGSSVEWLMDNKRLTIKETNVDCKDMNSIMSKQTMVMLDDIVRLTDFPSGLTKEEQLAYKNFFRRMKIQQELFNKGYLSDEMSY